MKTKTPKDVSQKEPTEKFSIVPQWLISNQSISPIQFKICTFLIGTYQMKKGNKDYTIEEIARETAIDVRVVRRNMKSFFIPNNILIQSGVKKDITKSFKPFAIFRFNYSNLKKLCKIEEKPVKGSESFTSDVEKVFESFANLLTDSDLTNSTKIVKDLESFVRGLVRGSNVGQEGKEVIKEEVREESTVNINVLSTENIETPAEGKTHCEVSKALGSLGPSEQEKTTTDNSQSGQNTAENGNGVVQRLNGVPQESTTTNKPGTEQYKNPHPSMAPGPKPEKDTNSKPFQKTRREQLEASGRDYTKSLTSKCR